MKIIPITRFDVNELSTIGRLDIDDKWCYILEDTLRNVSDKIYGETCIPNGLYKLKLVKYGKLHTWLSKKFPDIYKGVILLENVEGFSGICFHPGETRKNTFGCLLPCGKYDKRKICDEEEFFTTWDSSYAAFKAIYPKIVDYILKEDTYFQIKVALT